MTGSRARSVRLTNANELGSPSHCSLWSPIPFSIQRPSLIRQYWGVKV
ncbi:unnamed protein product [Rhodiola kirilowii]